MLHWHMRETKPNVIFATSEATPTGRKQKLCAQLSLMLLQSLWINLNLLCSGFGQDHLLATMHHNDWFKGVGGADPVGFKDSTYTFDCTAAYCKNITRRDNGYPDNRDIFLNESIFNCRIRHSQQEMGSKFIREVQLLEHDRHIGVPISQLIYRPYHYPAP